ncbi:MAG: hypothetical protein HQL28_03655 [Candidatus Omnitrophica bacterium]|nr:hypothetical protein [Candidatus Omnitrophota bacterium]
MIGKNKDKCVSPWIGFLVIIGVCIVIGAGVFFEFRGKGKSPKVARQTARKQAAIQAAMKAKLPDADAPGDKMTF